MRAPPDKLLAGAVIEVAHPFVWDTYNGIDEDGPFEGKSWRPGVRTEMVGPEDADVFADAIGAQILTIISIHKPGRFPERVFYTRQWRDPAGREFGKGKMHIKVSSAFRRIINGYRHEYQMSGHLNGAVGTIGGTKP